MIFMNNPRSELRIVSILFCLLSSTGVGVLVGGVVTD